MGGVTLATGLLALALILTLGLGSVAALIFAADPSTGLTAADWSALRFTLLQAILSACLSTLIAIPLARALARRRFPGRAAIVTLLGAPFILPTIVAIFGLLAIWGRSGLLSGLSLMAGGPRIDIYGLTGIVLAHVFYNLPLVTRLLLQGWSAIPPEHFRTAAQLGFTPRDIFTRLEAPMLRATLPGAFTLVFLLCMTSFAVALTLGGGPRATTLELAIFEALRFDFDLTRAALLALIQFALCLATGLIALTLTRPAAFGPALLGPVRRWDADSRLHRSLDTGFIATGFAFLALPLAAIAWRGLPGLARLTALPGDLWSATLTSLAIALTSALAATALACSLAALTASLRRAAPLPEIVALTMIAASPFVIGTGLFLILNPLVSPFAIAYPVTALVNAAMATPFALRILAPALAEARRDYAPLTASLGIEGLARLRYVTWPLLRRPLGFATGLAAALSVGDLGVIALFAPPDGATLPLYMYRLMGAYRMDEAAAAALLLLALALALFWIFDRGARLGP